jgi:hypothetical protein
MLTLPARHTEEELALARLLADRLELAELHVFWSVRRAPARGMPLQALTVLGGWCDVLLLGPLRRRVGSG